MSMKRPSLLVLVALACAFPAFSKDQPAAALTGVVTSEAEGRMEGVLVTARPQGANMTVTVVSDDQGRFAFPPGKLQPGKYALTIRAVGYELAGQTAAEIKPGGAARADIKLVKTKDLASQLTGAEWMMSIPGNEKQKKALFHCDQCHSLDKVAKSTYDVDGWFSTLHRMQNQWQAGSTFTHPMPPTYPPKEYPTDPELAKYLSSINLSGDKTTWPYELKTFPRPRGADTRVVITEYEIPREGNSPHDLAIDRDGMVWYDDFQSPNIGRLDPRTGQFKEWVLPRLKPSLPSNSLTIELDHQGNPWLPRGYQGCSVTMFDVKTEKFQTWSAPAEYNDDHSSCTQGNVGPNGMVWFNSFNTSKMFELDPKTGDVKVFNAFPPGSVQYKGPNRVFYFGIDENFATSGKDAQNVWKRYRRKWEPDLLRHRGEHNRGPGSRDRASDSLSHADSGRRSASRFHRFRRKLLVRRVDGGSIGNVRSPNEGDKGMASASSMERHLSGGARQKWRRLVGSHEHGLRPQTQPKNGRMAGIHAADSWRRDAGYQDCRRGSSAASLGASGSCRHPCQDRTAGVADCRK